MIAHKFTAASYQHNTVDTKEEEEEEVEEEEEQRVFVSKYPSHTKRAQQRSLGFNKKLTDSVGRPRAKCWINVDTPTARIRPSHPRARGCPALNDTDSETQEDISALC